MIKFNFDCKIEARQLVVGNIYFFQVNLIFKKYEGQNSPNCV
jgi:hypothetical protein